MGDLPSRGRPPQHLETWRRGGSKPSRRKPVNPADARHADPADPAQINALLAEIDRLQLCLRTAIQTERNQTAAPSGYLNQIRAQIFATESAVRELWPEYTRRTP